MIRKFLRIAVFGGILMLTACGDHNNSRTSATPPPAPATSDFQAFVEGLTQKNTCENNAAVDVNSPEFAFAADQDVASPASVDSINPGCSS